MIDSVTVDHARFDAQLDALLQVSRKDAVLILVDEHRRLTQLAVDFAPPPKHVGDPQAVGELAVKKDLYSLISEADERSLKPIMNEFGTENIDTYRVFSGEKVHLQWDNIAVGSAQVAELHNQYRQNNGRPKRFKAVQGAWKSRIVVAKGLRDEYVAAVQQRVGRMKAKLAYCASILGATFPEYISRHFGTIAGEAVAQIDLQSENPSITFGGRGRGFGQVRHALKSAGNIRAKQMKERLKYLARGYAENIKNGVKPQVGKFTGEQFASLGS